MPWRRGCAVSGNGRPPSETAAGMSPLSSATQQLMSGDAQAAVKTLHGVLAREPNNGEALHMLGLIACKAGDNEAGIKLLGRAAELCPGEAAVHYNLGNAYRTAQRFPAAAASYQRSLELAPDNSQTCHAMAETLLNLRQPEEAVTFFQRAVDADPNDHQAAARLAVLYEQHNQEARARELAEQLIESQPDNSTLNLVLARCDKRDGKTDAATERLRTHLEQNVESRTDFRLHHELGRLYDMASKTEEAFASFVTANRLQEEKWSETEDEEPSSVAYIDIQQKVFTRDWVASWSAPAPDGDDTPVFLLGFPRSGSTLLDQILDSHDEFTVLEERPAVAAMREQISQSADGYPEGMVSLTVDQIGKLREVYFAMVRRFIRTDQPARIVDKLPLNSVRAGLIHRVFPGARLIFALRHPHDVVLSCFMQEFELNSAMSNFLSLDAAADFYVKAMTLWNTLESLLPLKIHYVRYESLVADLEAETRALLGFLEVPFDEKVLEFSKHARSRGRINTPSYHQVSKPVYTSAVGRWQRYEKHLAHVLPKLEPFVKHFGYSSEQ